MLIIIIIGNNIRNYALKKKDKKRMLTRVNTVFKITLESFFFLKKPYAT